MFEIGFWELVMVGVVALIVVGPERLPGLARTAGLWVGKARRMIAQVKAEVDRELQLEELKQSFHQQANLSDLKDISERVKSLREDIQAEFDDPGPPPGWRPGMPTGAPPPPADPNPPAVPAVAAPAPVQLAKTEPKPVELPAVAPVPPPPSPSPPPSGPTS
jgi:sec-independent protein translocase protein TatB